MSSSNIIRHARTEGTQVLVPHQPAVRMLDVDGAHEGLPELPVNAEMHLQQELAAMRAGALQEAEALKAAARAEGFEQGLMEARAQLSDTLERLQTMGLQARFDTAQMLANAENEVIELVLLLATKVVQRELQTDPVTVLHAVRRGLEAAGSRAAVRVRVHPEDLPLLEERWSDLISDGDTRIRAELTADPMVEPGGCVVDTKNGSFDAQGGVLLAEIERTFREQAGEEL